MRVTIIEKGGANDGRAHQFDVRPLGVLAWHDQPQPVDPYDPPVVELRNTGPDEVELTVRMRP